MFPRTITVAVATATAFAIVSTLLLMLFPVSAFAYSKAKVVAERAIVYADPECKIPIGQISNGKNLYVSKVHRGKSGLPVVITVTAGKYSYIKAADLAVITTGEEILDVKSTISDDATVIARSDNERGRKIASIDDKATDQYIGDERTYRNYQIEELEKTRKKLLKKSLQSTYQNYSFNFNNSKGTVNMFTFGGEVWPKRYFGNTAAFVYSTSDNPDLKFKSYGFTTGGIVSIVRFLPFSLEAFADILYFYDEQFTYVEDGGNTYIRLRGTSYGYRFGADLVYLSSFFHVKAGACYMSLLHKMHWRDSSFEDDSIAHPDLFNIVTNTITYKVTIGWVF